MDVDHTTLGKFRLVAEQIEQMPEMLFTENETNLAKIFKTENRTPYVKDAFHRYLINSEEIAVNPKGVGSKAGDALLVQHPRWRAGRRATAPLSAGPGAAHAVWGGIRPHLPAAHQRSRHVLQPQDFQDLPVDTQRIARQGFAGLLWSKQFYHYIVREWLSGDPDRCRHRRRSRWKGRNKDWWPHLFNRDVISMPDKWEYPWYAAWDLAFHMMTFAQIDPQFAKEQLLLHDARMVHAPQRPVAGL